MKLLPSIKTSLDPIDVEAKPIDSNKLFDIEKVTKVLLKIEKKTIKIDKLLKRSLNSRLRNDRLLRTRREQQSFDQREQELEQKKPKESKKLNIKFPRAFGIFDWIKNFLFNVILGFIAVRLIKFLPNLIGLLPIISKAADFIIDIGGKLLNGLVTFIDWGYKAYDSTRGFVRNIFGEDGAKKFDDLASKFNTFMNLAIIAGMAATGLGSGRGGRSGFGGGRGRPNGRPGVTQSGGGRAGRPDIRNPLRERSNVTQSGGGRAGRPDIRNPLRGRPNITGTLTEGAGGTAARGAGRFGAKLGTLGTKGIPIIGPLLDFGIRTLVLGESPGRAAAGAVGVAVGQILGSIVGTWIGGAIGGIAGSIVPFIGNLLVGGAGAAIGGIVGELAGAFLGDMLGTSLYDLVFQSGGSKHMAEGGSATTRSSNLSGPSTRTLSKKKVQRTVTPVPRKIKPGASAGGEKKYQEMFPDTDDQQKDKKDSKKKQNPFQYSLKSSEILGKTNFFGPLFSLALKSHLGDLPTDVDYTLAAKGLNSWLNSTMDFRAIAAAGGGTIDVESFGQGDDYIGAIKDSIKDSAAPQIDKTNKELIKNLGLEKSQPETVSEKDKKGTTEDSSGDEEGGEDISMGGSFDENLSKLLKSYEGLRLKAYKDTAGIPTIGMGATYYTKGFRLSGKVKMGDTITEEEAIWLKKQHIKEHRQRLLNEIPASIYNKVPDNVKAALESKTFNYGSVGSTLANLVKTSVQTGNYSPVSAYFRGTLAQHDGGVNSWRRNDEAGIIDTGRSSRAGISFPKKSGSAAAAAYGGKVDEPGGTGNLPGGVVSKNQRTGPSAYIGGSTEYHVDTKFHKSLGISNMVAAVDRMARAYSSRGRKMEFSNPGVAGIVWNPQADANEKRNLLQRAFNAHSHSQFMRAEGFLPFDYYIPKKNENRFGKSVEGAQMILPSFGGKIEVGTKYSGYGKSAEIFNTSGKMVALTGHGDIRYETGGETIDGPHHAIIGEKGKEYVIDADSYRVTQKLIPGMLDILNYKVKNTETLKKNIPSIISSLQKYAPYEPEVNHLVIFNNNQPSSGSSHSSYSEAPSLSRSNIDSRTDQFQILNMV